MGWGPVLNLQARLRVLEMYFLNDTLAAEDSPSFSLLQSAHPGEHLAQGAWRLQVLQAQLTWVRVSHEHLLQRVDNFTQNPGLASSPLGWDFSTEVWETAGSGTRKLRTLSKQSVTSNSQGLRATSSMPSLNPESPHGSRMSGREGKTQSLGQFPGPLPHS